MKILLTGANGLLGSELQKLMDFEYTPTSKELNIRDMFQVKEFFKNHEIDLVVHCAAYTDVVNAEHYRRDCYSTNVLGSSNISFRPTPKTLYISTEYVFSGEGAGFYSESDYPMPINYYGLTKYLGEEVCVGKVIRTLFKPRPWKYDKAWYDQFTSGDYVDVIAKEIVLAIKNYDLLPRITHIGTERKSIHSLARQSRPDVRQASRLTASVRLPMDASLNCSRWEELKNASTFKT